jgi:hypothetical protein
LGEDAGIELGRSLRQRLHRLAFRPTTDELFEAAND